MSPKARKIIEAIRGGNKGSELAPVKREEIQPRHESTEPTQPKEGWMVMKAHQWSSLTIPALGGMSITIEPDQGPQRFIPVFDTYDQALRFTSDPSLIIRIEEITR